MRKQNCPGQSYEIMDGVVFLAVKIRRKLFDRRKNITEIISVYDPWIVGNYMQASHNYSFLYRFVFYCIIFVALKRIVFSAY